MLNSRTPKNSYGVLDVEQSDSELAIIAEQIRRLGYAVLPGGYLPDQVAEISSAFDRVHQEYIARFGLDYLKMRGEEHLVRSPLVHGDPLFTRVAANQRLLELLGKLIPGKFILNQQNGVVNPPSESYSQGAWHRDLAYQHYVSSVPLAVNALYCVDDFTLENGATFVSPATHKESKFPSDTFLSANSIQVEAKAGDFLVLDCMLYHSGGANRTTTARRGLNHVYTIPYFRQQINLPRGLESQPWIDEYKDLLGFGFSEPQDVEQYLAARPILENN